MKFEDLTKAEPNTIFGCDVSSYQGKNTPAIWEKAEELGLSFCYCKVTEGKTIQDSQFNNNYLTLKDAYVPAGGYHFFRGGHDGKEQAENFLGQIASIYDTQDLPPVIDVEALYDGVSVDVQIDYILQWCEIVEKELLTHPMVYTSLRVIRDLFKNTTRLSHLPLWTVDYRPKITEPRIPSGFTDWKIWQFSDKLNCLGFRMCIDVNRFHGSIDDLSTFITESHF